MNKEEVKQWLRTQIDSCIINEYNKNEYNLCYNKNYLRALKLSKITGQPVNIENFKGGEKLFGFNTKTKEFVCYNEIYDYLDENYTKEYMERMKIIEEVIKEYSEYKDYKYW